MTQVRKNDNATMKQTLSRDHRGILDTTVAQVRADAEAGAEKAFLPVSNTDPQRASLPREIRGLSRIFRLRPP